MPVKIKDHNDKGKSHTQRRLTPSLMFWFLSQVQLSTMSWDTKPVTHSKLPSLIYSTTGNRHSHQPGACLRVESWKEKRRETKRCLAPLLEVRKTPFSLGHRRKQTASAIPQPWQHARTCTRISSGFTKTMKCGEPGSYMKHTPAIYKIRKAAASKAQSRFYQQGFN